MRTTPSEVYNVLVRLKPCKAPGSDGITPRLLSACSCGIAVSLSRLFNRSFAEACVPQEWKDALVVPIFKSGSKSSATNYRPIALLSLVSKTLEKIVSVKLSYHLQPFLSSRQSGFRRKYGTELQLLRLVQEWSSALDSGKYVGVVFFDIKKAFDRVWHDGLLCKLQSLGVSGSALQWFHSFLSNRRQRVIVGNSTSEFQPLHAGVPQGAILSPLLFLVYVNDMPDATSAELNLFADDTSAYITDKSPAALQTRLQTVVDELEVWFRKWALTVNTVKSALMVIGSRRRVLPQLAVSIYGQQIKQVISHKHLGVHLHSNLSWSHHVAYVVKKASQRIGLLRRLQRRLPQLVIRQIYMTCVRPVLEYAARAWSGVNAAEAKSLERTQRSAARLITGTKLSDELPHAILLARAGLEQLRVRRQLSLLVLARRLRRDPPRAPAHLVSLFQTFSGSAPSSTTMSLRSVSVRLPRPRTELFRRSPLYLAFSLQNSLPESVKSSLSALTSYLASL